MAQAVDRFLFGLCFGVGFFVAYGVCTLLASLFGHAGLPNIGH